MNRGMDYRLKPVRVCILIGVGALHAALLLFAAFRIENAVTPAKPAARIMKLVDVREYIAPPYIIPPAERPPRENPPETPRTNAEEPVIAENVIETEEVPPPETAPAAEYITPGEIEYLSQNSVTRLPALPEDDILRATVYPPIALRSGIEGIVYLEILIDRGGIIRGVRVLRENPPGRGFAGAALNAFNGIRALRPAELNGAPAAVRYRYSVMFRIR